MTEQRREKGLNLSCLSCHKSQEKGYENGRGEDEDLFPLRLLTQLKSCIDLKDNV